MDGRREDSSMFRRPLHLMILLTSCFTRSKSFSSFAGRVFDGSISRILTVEAMNGLLQRIKENNDVESSGGAKSFVPFIVQNEIIGYVKPSLCNRLTEFSAVFQLTETQSRPSLRFTSDIERQDCAFRSAALAEVTSTLREEGLVSGWRNELVEASSDFNSSPSFLIERAAYPLFGIKGYGVHINGYIRNPVDRRIEKIWVAKRSKTKSTWPSMYDHIVAGGQPSGITLTENVIKECDEEASIPLHIAKEATPAGIVSYCCLDGDANLKRDVLFCYDLGDPFL